MGSGALLGALGGLVAGDDHRYCGQPPQGQASDIFGGIYMALQNASYQACLRSQMTATQKAVGYGALLGAAGALTGLIVGALARTDIWVPTGLERQLVEITPSVGAEGLGLSFTIPTR